MEKFLFCTPFYRAKGNLTLHYAKKMYLIVDVEKHIYVLRMSKIVAETEKLFFLKDWLFIS